MFTTEEMKSLTSNSLSLTNAKHFAQMIKSDLTIGGIFPNAYLGDFSEINTEKFQSKFCGFWPLAKKLLSLAKVFTNDKIDTIIDKLIAFGDVNCN